MSGRALRHVVMYSGGIGSWAAAKRVASKFGTDDLTLLFSDTLIEDADLYRFLIEGAANVFTRPGVLDGIIHLARALPPSSDMDNRRSWLVRLRQQCAVALPGLTWLADGRTIWEVFRDERFLGNSRVDPCSRILKRESADRWLARNCDPDDTIVYVGIDWTEEHRYTRLRDYRAAKGWRYEAPLCEEPYASKHDVREELFNTGIELPRLYQLGFSHNNCGGGCVKAGLGHFAHLHNVLPAIYAEWEQNEESLRQFLGRDDIAILRDRTGGEIKPVTLHQLRKRIEAGHQPDLFEIGGCGCFVDEPEVA